jgi:hypothetical protein
MDEPDRTRIIVRDRKILDRAAFRQIIGEVLRARAQLDRELKVVPRAVRAQEREGKRDQ